MMRRSKKISLLLLVFLSFCRGYSQGQSICIKGRILDRETKETLPYASVFLQKLTGPEFLKGGISDEQGCFRVKFIPGQYLLNVRYVGYANFMKFVDASLDTVVDCGDLFLMPVAKELDAVEVRPLVEQSADQIIYNFSSDPDWEKASVAQLLQKVPMIKTTPTGDLYIGSQDKKFLVVRNGKRDALFSGSVQDVLKDLPARGFGKVRLLLAPPEYYGACDYVLDIVTDKTVKVVGAVGNIQGNYRFRENRWNLSPASTFSSRHLRGHLKADIRRASPPEEQKNSRQIYLGSAGQNVQEQKSSSFSEDYEGSGSFSYDMGERQFVSFRIKYNFLNNDQDSRLRVRSVQEEQILKSYTTLTDARQNRRMWDASLDYQYDFNKPDRLLNVSWFYRNNPSEMKHEVNNIGEVNYENQSFRDKTTDKSIEQSVQIAYTDPFTKFLKLEMILKYLHREYNTWTDYDNWNEDRAWWEWDVSRISGVRKKNDIWSAYFRLIYHSKKLRLSAAVRNEYLDDGRGSCMVSGETERYIKEKGNTLLPDASVSYRLPNVMLQLKYEYRQRRPALEFLNVAVPDPDAEMIQTGNPDLKPERYHWYYLSLYYSKQEKFSMNLGLRYRYTDNAISRYWYTNERKQTIQTYRNFGHASSVSANAYLTYRLTSFDVTLMSQFDYSIRKYSPKEDMKNIQIMLGPNISYTTKRKWIFFIAGGYVKNYSWGMEGYSVYPWALQGHVNKKFCKDKLGLELGMEDMLKGKRRSTVRVKTPEMEMETRNRSGRIAFSFSLSYRFGTFKVKPVRQASNNIIINDVLNVEELDAGRAR